MKFLSRAPFSNSRKISALACPFPGCLSQTERPGSRRPVRFGFFTRREDSRRIQRFRCPDCRRSFSRATFHAAYRQKRRRLNRPLYELLASQVGLRRSALLLRTTYPTIVRKQIFLGRQTMRSMERDGAVSAMLESKFPKKTRVLEVQFDEVETFEHTKLKPLSIALAVDTRTQRILSVQVARMPAKGPLAEKSRKKYGRRRDERSLAMKRMLFEVKAQAPHLKAVRSDSNPHYPGWVRAALPGVRHEKVVGRKPASVGQGELRKGGFDPLFALNHAAAMLRANINRLARKTWCTTKKPERLALHLALYAHFHNTVLLPRRRGGRSTA